MVTVTATTKIVSPWEIERIGGTFSAKHCLSSCSKRTKLCFPQGDVDTLLIGENGRPDSMATDSFQRVLQGQELMRSSTSGVSCSHSQKGEFLLTRISADKRNCLFNDAVSGLRHQNNPEFPYQPLRFNESVRFSKVLQGQEMSRIVPLYRNTSDASTQNGRVGSSDYEHWPTATQGYSHPCFTPSPAEVCSPSSVLMFNQTMVPHPDFEGPINLKDAYGSRCAPLHQMQGKTEYWSFVQKHQTPCVTEGNQFDLAQGSTPSNVGNPESAGKEIGRSSCRLFGFSLTEKMLATEDNGVQAESYGADRQAPRVLDLFGHGQSTARALHDLCSAPLRL